MLRRPPRSTLLPYTTLFPSLPLLYGERDQHLDRIERQLGVSLVPRGNRLSIAGPASATEVARLTLSRLYDRLKRGQALKGRNQADQIVDLDVSVSTIGNHLPKIGG